MRDTDSTERLLAIVERLYEAAVRSDAWPRFLEDLMSHFGAHGAHVGNNDTRNQALTFSVLHGFDHYIQTRYANGPGESLLLGMRRFEEHFAALVADDPRATHALRHPNKPTACREPEIREALRESAVYREILHPSDIEHTMIVAIPGEAGEYIGLGVFRGAEDPPFTNEEAAEFGLLVPHVRRAVMLRRTVVGLQSRNLALQQSLDILPMGVLILNRDQQVVARNALARRILGNDIYTPGDCDRFIPVSRLGKAVASAAQRVLSNDERSPDGIRETFPMPKPGSTGTYSVLVCPLGSDSLGVNLDLIDESRALVLITDPDVDSELPSELLQRLFGLTRAESEILAALVAGSSLRESAALANISYHTARTHLQAIFEKTATSRQTDLIRKVLASPLWIAKVGEHGV